MNTEKKTMKNSFKFISVLLCMIILVSEYNTQAQNKRTGTAAATQLLIPSGGRDFALGGSSIATTSGVEAMYWNPAGLARMKDAAQGMFSDMTYIADIGVSNFAVGGTFGDFGTVGMSIKSLDFGKIPNTTEDDPENSGERFYSPDFSTLAFTYAKNLSDAVTVGLTGKIVSEKILDANSTGYALDMGVQYANLVGITGLDLGIAIRNIGPKMQYGGSGLYRKAEGTTGSRPEQAYKLEAATFELPTTIDLGVAYNVDLDAIKASFTGAYSNNSLYVDEFKFGGEVSYTASDGLIIYGRGGKAAAQVTNADDDIFGIVMGGGVTFTTEGLAITVDFANRAVKDLGNNNVLSVKLGF